MPKEGYFSAKILYDSLPSYYGRKIKVKCKDGIVFEARAGYYLDWFSDDEEDLKDGFAGTSIDLDDVICQGEEVLLGSICFADIAGFLPLEGENTPEFIKEHHL